MANIVLDVDDVQKSFGGLHALTDINLQIEEGKTRAIIGPNGAGKSTLLNICVGRIAPDAGSVRLDGTTLTGKHPHEINQLGVARVFQTPEIFPGPLRAAQRADPGAGQARRRLPRPRLEELRLRSRSSRQGPRDDRGRRPREPHGAGGGEPVARRQAAARACHVPGPAAAPSAPRRAHRRHVAARHQPHHRSAQEDQGARHDQGHHRARHARRLLSGRPRHRAGAAAASSPTGRPSRCAAIRKVQEAYLGGAHQ